MSSPTKPISRPRSTTGTRPSWSPTSNPCTPLDSDRDNTEYFLVFLRQHDLFLPQTFDQPRMRHRITCKETTAASSNFYSPSLQDWAALDFIALTRADSRAARSVKSWPEISLATRLRLGCVVSSNPPARQRALAQCDTTTLRICQVSAITPEPSWVPSWALPNRNGADLMSFALLSLMADAK